MTAAAAKPFELSVDSSGDGASTVVRLVGDLDLLTAPEVEACLLALDETDVIVDLAGVTFVDLAGLDAIVQANRQANFAGRSFALRTPSGAVMQLLQDTGLDRAVAIEG